MGRFFPYANINQIINNMKENSNKSYNDTFLYPKNGAQTFLNKLYDNLDKDKVKLNTEIKSIDLKNKKAITTDGTEINYEYLINTAPLNKFLNLFDDEKSKKLESELSYNKVLVFNLGFEKKSDFKEHWIYFPDKSINFYRAGFYNNILNEEKLSMYIEIGFSKNEEINVEEQLRLTLENLEKLGISKDNKLEEYSTIIMDPGYVHINGKTNQDVLSYIDDLGKENVYSIGRYGSWTYCSMEDAMIWAKELSEKIK